MVYLKHFLNIFVAVVPQELGKKLTIPFFCQIVYILQICILLLQQAKPV